MIRQLRIRSHAYAYAIHTNLYGYARHAHKYAPIYAYARYAYAYAYARYAYANAAIRVVEDYGVRSSTSEWCCHVRMWHRQSPRWS